MNPDKNEAIHAIQNDIRPLFETFYSNMNRVVRLCQIAKQMAPCVDPNDPTTDPSDILRAAVVLLHATGEELLRTIGAVYLMNADRRTLPDVLNCPSESVKFQQASPEELLSMIGKHLNRKTFGDIRDICDYLRACRIPYPDHTQDKSASEDFKLARRMLKRRHAIVHCCDVHKSKEQAIDVASVERWTQAVSAFARTLHMLLTIHHPKFGVSPPAVDDEAPKKPVKP